MTTEITNASAVTLAGLIKSRAVSCREVMVAFLRQIELCNPHLNAIVSMRDAEILLDEADEKDRQLSMGNYSGLLHGFPQAPKDTSAVRGMASTYGSPLLKDCIPAEDAIFAGRMRSAGAIFVGRTNAPEFGLGGQTYNSVFGTTFNAYDPTKTAGGSSGGAAVALASRMLPVADGSDMIGSLRTPAAFNNVFGFRPSRGVIPFGPAPELYFQQLIADGAMARNIPDLAVLLQVMAGHDARAPLSLHTNPHAYASKLERDFKGTRIGWIRDWDGYFPVERDVLETCDKSMHIFESLGCIVETVGRDELQFDPARLWSSILVLRNFLIAGMLGAHYSDPESRQRLKPEAIWEIEHGLALSGSDVYRASLDRSEWYTRLLKIFTRFDYLILPGALTFPFAASLHWPREVAGRSMDTYHRWIELTIPATLAGLPAMSVPVGFNDEGLPMGIQILGPVEKDFSVMQLAHQFDIATGYSRKCPSLSGAVDRGVAGS